MTGSIWRLAITPGEPAGIGPDLAVAISQLDWDHELVFIADPDLLAQRARLLGKGLHLRCFDPKQPPRPSRAGEACLLPVPLHHHSQPGILNRHNAIYVLNTLQTAVNALTHGQCQALVTGPLHKGIINDAGIPFTGHTEWLAEQSGNCPVVMMLACPQLRVALATTHLPLRQVASAINQESLSTTLSILHHSLQRDFAIPQPRILVAGLNPHAGEGGHMGDEEITTIAPVCRQAQQRGWQISDPLPADTLFTPAYLKRADAILAMYHDQGLPVLKHLCFGQAVNITLGLSFIRTSVDHGTALDLAGSGRAESGSFIAAVHQAIRMVQHRSLA